MSPISGYLPGMHGDAVKVRPGREKTKWRCRLDSIPRTGCFLCVFVHLLRTLPKEVIRSTATKVESGISDANRRSLVSERRVKKDRMLVALVSERRVKKDRTLVEKFQIVLLQLRAAEHPIQLVKNQKQGLCTGILSRGNHRQSKPKESKVEVRDLRGILVRSSWAQSQAVGRSIYIYIYKTEVCDRVCVHSHFIGRMRIPAPHSEISWHAAIPRQVPEIPDRWSSTVYRLESPNLESSKSHLSLYHNPYHSSNIFPNWKFSRHKRVQPLSVFRSFRSRSFQSQPSTSTGIHCLYDVDEAGLRGWANCRRGVFYRFFLITNEPCPSFSFNCFFFFFF